jgi:hypothetical protein
MVFTFCSELARRFGIARLVHKLASGIDRFIRSFPSIQRATLYRGRRDWPVADPIYGTYGIIYCAFITLFVFSAYYDTLACYTRGLRYYAGVVAYEPCESVGINKPEFQVCKNRRSWLFFVQMLSLGFSIVPAYVLLNTL